ncbi:organic cation transporter protein-like [Glandiceps talaboti]
MPIDYDNLLKNVVGEFGPYQKRCVLLLSLVMVPSVMNVVCPVFILPDTNHWCSIPQSDTLTEECRILNSTELSCPRLVRDLILPSELHNGVCDSGSEWSNCRRYDLNLTDFDSLLRIHRSNVTLGVMECDQGWDYDTSQYASTVTQQFDLVCDKKYLSSLSTSLYMAGILVGNTIFGLLSDRVTELVGPSKRTFVSMTCNIFYGLGYVGLAVYAYFLRDWKILILTINLPCVLFFSYWWLICESPRWLLSVGRTLEAEKCIIKMAQVNKVSLPENIFTEAGNIDVISTDINDAVSNTESSLIDLFRLPNLRKNCGILFYASFSSCLVYYGFTLNTSNIGGDDYINCAVAGAVEIPANLLTAVLLETRLGRKLTWSGASLSCGFISFLVLLIPKCGSLLWLRITLTMLGKLFVTSVYSIILIYSVEVFPTTVRSFGVSLTSIIGTIGSMLAPQILFARTVWEPIPEILFSVLPITSGLLILLLPETRGRKLPETLEEGETFGR